MKNIKRFPEIIPFHPFLLGIYPVLFLWLFNIDQIPFYAIFRSLFFTIGLICFVYILSIILFRKTLKAAIFTSFFLLLFLTFGHIIGLFDGATIWGITIGKFRYYSILKIFSIFWFLLLLAGMIVIWKAKSNFHYLNRILNLISTFLVGIVLLQVMVFVINTQQPTEIEQIESQIQNPYSRTTSSMMDRDIYYIVLDSYGRQDVLRDDYDFDNSTFIQELKKLGFIIPDCAMSNYDTTELSMTASLNMDYLDNLGLKLDPDAEKINADDFYNYLQHSLVRLKLEEIGYKTIAFKTIYPFIDIKDADYYYDVEASTNYLEKLESLNFQYLFFKTTWIRLIIDYQKYSPEYFDNIPPAIMAFINPKANLFSSRYLRQYNQNVYALESLQKIPLIPEKKFIYAHLFITHQPFVFTPDGKFRWPVLENDAAYKDQVIYGSQRMIEIIKEILDQSATPPIIILQGDHSYSWSQNRNRILNAYYLPEDGDTKLYATITPVNTFRLIFNHYFGGEYPFLPDIVYYSNRNRPYDFIQLPITCVGITDSEE